jgi:hypothetical protein
MGGCEGRRDHFFSERLQKKFMTFLSFLAIQFSLFSGVGFSATPGNFDLKITSELEKSNLLLVVDSSKGHHFNLKAPISLTIHSGKSISNKVVPSRKETSQIQFSIPAPKASENYEMRLYVCDDAQTYCKLKILTAQWDEKKSQLIQN